MVVDIEVNIARTCTLTHPDELTSIMNDAQVLEMFDYALSTPHRKTVLAGLNDCAGNYIGELIVSFRPQ